KPYGSDAGFVNECTGCHEPLAGNNYVYTMPMAAVSARRAEVVNSRAASLGQMPLPLAWRPITLFVDRAASTISVFFDIVGILARATWNERDDPHWFGARIPDQPVSLETLQVAPDGEAGGYRRFNSTGQAENSLPDAFVTQRTAFLRSLTPAQLP